MPRAEQITASVTYHGEGAVWHAGWGGLRLVDMLAGDVLSLDEATGTVSRLHVDSPVAALLRPRTAGGFVVATERGFAGYDARDRREWVTPDLWDGPIRFNEGAVDPRGRLLAGQMAYAQTPGAASMWRLNVDRSAERLFGGLTISNGLGFTADGTRAYFDDTATGRIDVFDVEDGELGERRPFVTLPEGVGGPDGLCVDAEDGVWVALYGGAAVRRYDADGALSEIVEVGAERVTSCALGGLDGTTLYITTSREGLEPHEEPAAGAMFRAEVGVTGAPIRTVPL
ncbi:SMP-30/gluconolactonase/LRE family protein [Microbacterium rhizophilus]|uniref:SMP-30/gluconolactonase/LRE family protein n=1 Tax=Microbacterium rhizophilus TaxID=3138934 RepID=UPI0031ED53F9